MYLHAIHVIIFNHICILITGNYRIFAMARSPSIKAMYN